MALHVTKSCPSCGEVYSRGRDSRGIGQPFHICESCGTYLIDKDEMEWELMDGFRRFRYLFVCVWTAVLYGFLITLIGFLVANDFTKKYFALLYLSGVLLFALALLRTNLHEIKESRKRMDDPDYRALLRYLKILK